MTTIATDVWSMGALTMMILFLMVVGIVIANRE